MKHDKTKPLLLVSYVVCAAIVLVIACRRAGMGVDSYKMRACSYLERRYENDKFIYEGMDSPVFALRKVLRFSSKEYPEHDVLVSVDWDILSDNYLSVQFEEDVQSYLETCVEEHFSDAEVYYQSPKEDLYTRLPSNATMIRYLQTSTSLHEVVVVVGEDELSSIEEVRALSENMNTFFRNYSLRVVALADTDACDMDKARSRIEKGDYYACGLVFRYFGETAEEWNLNSSV